MDKKKGEINVYKLKSPKVSGNIYLTFHNQHLKAFELDLNKPLSDSQFAWLRARLPKYEPQIKELTKGTNFECQYLKPKSVQDKIILFCQYYKHYRGVSYKAKTVESANVKTVPVQPEYLDIFFQMNLQNFTLENYIYRINQVKDQLHNGIPDKRFPNTYDPDFEKRLDTGQLQEYYAHLRKIGYVYANGKWKEKKEVENEQNR